MGRRRVEMGRMRRDGKEGRGREGGIKKEIPKALELPPNLASITVLLNKFC